MVFIGNHLVEVMNYASKIFEAPPWTWKENELTHWFGFDMTKVASFEDKIEILEKFPRINSAIQTALFRDLERFVRHMHNLRPGVSVSQAERWKSSQSSTLWPPWREQSSEGCDVQSKMTDAISRVTFAGQSGFAACRLQFVLWHSSLQLSCGVFVTCLRNARWGPLWMARWQGLWRHAVTIHPVVQAVEHFAKTQIKWGWNYFGPSIAHDARKPY